jgi:hypothetical protein
VAASRRLLTGGQTPLLLLPSKMDENSWQPQPFEYRYDGPDDGPDECDGWYGIHQYDIDLSMREEWERDRQREEKEPEEEVEGEPAETAVDVDAVDDVEVATASGPVEGATAENAPVQNAVDDVEVATASGPVEGATQGS